MWSEFTTLQKILILAIGIPFAYIIVRLLSFAVFKSWIDAFKQKTLKKEDNDEL